MSRHYHKTQYLGKNVIVMMGFDRKLRGFFMVIEYAEIETDDYVYSNLYEADPYPKSLTRYKDILQSLRISVPEQMLAEVERDYKNKVGNKDVVHSIENKIYTRRLDFSYELDVVE